MPDTAAHPTQKQADKDEPKTSKKNLAPAGESSNPNVHMALANLQAARDNRATLDVPEPDIKKADEAVKAAEKALADLGYEA